MAEVDHLAAERATARFDVEEMKVAWAGSRHAVHVADRMARLVASDPVSRPANPTPPRLDLAPLPHPLHPAELQCAKFRRLTSPDTQIGGQVPPASCIYLL